MLQSFEVLAQGLLVVVRCKDCRRSKEFFVDERAIDRVISELQRHHAECPLATDGWAVYRKDGGK